MGTVIRLSGRSRAQPQLSASSELSDWDLWAVGLLLWAASLARVGQAVAEREVFGAEASLAFLCTFALPALALRRWLYRRAKAKRLRQGRSPDRRRGPRSITSSAG
jgi:hypothetical protein